MTATYLAVAMAPVLGLATWRTPRGTLSWSGPNTAWRKDYNSARLDNKESGEGACQTRHTTTKLWLSQKQFAYVWHCTTGARRMPFIPAEVASLLHTTKGRAHMLPAQQPRPQPAHLECEFVLLLWAKGVSEVDSLCLACQPRLTIRLRLARAGKRTYVQVLAAEI